MIKKISENGFNLIKEFEGFSSTPYLCSAGVPTIGFGNTCYTNGQKVKLSDPPLSRDEANHLISNVVKNFEKNVSEVVKVPLTQNQFDALVSLAYNIGNHAFNQSTLLKLLNQGNYTDAANQFPKWCHASGKVIQGLRRRRQAEKALFLA